MTKEQRYEQVLNELRNLDNLDNLDKDQELRIKGVLQLDETWEILADATFPYGSEGSLLTVMRSLIIEYANRLLQNIKEEHKIVQ
jgi:hypothetical protein